MSRDASVEFVWGEGETKFALRIGELRDLEKKRDNTGAIEILRRLEEGTYLVDDVRETIRIGLIGGGKTPSEAHRLTVRYFDELPDLMFNAVCARAILLASVTGDPNDPKRKAAEAETKPVETDSPSPPTTDGEPS